MELKPTTRVAEALAVAQRAAQSAGHPEITPSHLALALAEQEGSTTPAAPHRRRHERRGRRREPRAACSTGCRAAAGRPSRPPASGRRRSPSSSTPPPSWPPAATPTCRPTSSSSPSSRRARSRATPARLEAELDRLRGGATVTSENPQEAGRGAAEVRHRPHRDGPRRPARPRHRARLRDPPRRAGALAAARRTTPSSSASPASARPPSSRGWPSASSTATSPSRCAASASSPSTSARWSPARSTAASSRSGSRPSSRRSRPPTARSSPSSTSCTPSSAPGATGESAMDASNMLKPMLARGELRLVGATTLDEFREHVEKDAALERRFQQVFVGEPSVEDTIAILRGLKERYEAHHKVEIEDSALVAAACAVRPLHQRAPAPRQGDRPRRRGRVAAADGDRLQPGRDRRAPPRRRPAPDGGAAPGEGDRRRVGRAARAAARRPRRQDRGARRPHGAVGVGEVRPQPARRAQGARSTTCAPAPSGSSARATTRAPRASSTARSRRSRRTSRRPSRPSRRSTRADLMVKERVGADDIAEVISAWTGIPAGRLLQGETEKLLSMESIIGSRLIGQADAVRAVSDAVRRSRAGIADPDRPTGSFLFLGPTGVGKTELAKSLADFLFDDERAMVRIDMSEYSERHAVARLIGAPPGYVGYEEGGQLTEAVRRRPYSVVLLDEVEKAHPETFDILLQVLDDGRLTDGQGRTVDFRNVILVMTSNLGSQFLVDPTMEPADQHEAVMATVRQAFKPEFLNRLDEVVVFDAAQRPRARADRRPPGAGARDPAARPPDRPSRSPTPRGPGSPSRATTRPTAPVRCAGSSSARSATGWPAPSSPATSATATPSPSTSTRRASPSASPDAAAAAARVRISGFPGKPALPTGRLPVGRTGSRWEATRARVSLTGMRRRSAPRRRRPRPRARRLLGRGGDPRRSPPPNGSPRPRPPSTARRPSPSTSPAATSRPARTASPRRRARASSTPRSRSSRARSPAPSRASRAPSTSSSSARRRT